MARSGHPETAVFLGGVLIALACAALGVAPGSSALVAAAAIAAAAGVPHGALDPYVAREAGLVRTRARLAGFLAAYTGLALAVIAAWLVAPAATLAGFLVISAWHFAGDWFEGRPAARLAAGLSLLSLPAALHGPQVAELYALLSGDGARAIALAQARLAPLWAALLAGCALLAALRSRRHGLELAAAGLAALALHPLIFFALYFALLHSPRHFLTLWRGAVDRRAFLRTAAIYTAISFTGAGLAAAVLLRGSGVEDAALQVAFIGLAALTLPHMALIAWMARRQAGLPPA